MLRAPGLPCQHRLPCALHTTSDANDHESDDAGDGRTGGGDLVSYQP